MLTTKPQGMTMIFQKPHGRILKLSETLRLIKFPQRWGMHDLGSPNPIGCMFAIFVLYGEHGASTRLKNQQNKPTVSFIQIFLSKHKNQH